MLIRVIKLLKQNSRMRWKLIKRSVILRNDANMMNYGRTINNGRATGDAEITIGIGGSLILEEVVGVNPIPCPQKILQKCSVVLEGKNTLISSLPSLAGAVGNDVGSAEVLP